MSAPARRERRCGGAPAQRRRGDAGAAGAGARGDAGAATRQVKKGNLTKHTNRLYEVTTGPVYGKRTVLGVRCSATVCRKIQICLNQLHSLFDLNFFVASPGKLLG